MPGVSYIGRTCLVSWGSTLTLLYKKGILNEEALFALVNFIFFVSVFRIKYMAFYISKSDHAKAREISKRALEKIHFREEAERLNIYLALFNMENACKNEEAAENVSKCHVCSNLKQGIKLDQSRIFLKTPQGKFK